MYLFYDIYIKICSASIWHWRIRRLLYNFVGMRIGNAAIHCDCYFSGKKFAIGNGSYINRQCSFDCNNGEIIIGSNVGIACNVKMYTTNHDYSSPEKRTGNVIGRSIIIRDGVWIGGGG